MEPGEKFIRRLLKFVLMILAFIIAIVFGEGYRGLGWLGALVFVTLTRNQILEFPYIGASMGALGIYLFKRLRS